MSLDGCNPDRSSIVPTVAGSDPYASIKAKLYSYYRLDESSGSAIDKMGVNNCLEVGSCPQSGSGGRVTSPAANILRGSAIDLSTVVAMFGWYQRKLAASLTIPFGNRQANGQFANVNNGGGTMGTYAMTPTQEGPIASIVDVSLDTWRFYYWEHTPATKTVGHCLDNAAITSGNYTGTLNLSGDALQLGGDQNVAFTTTWIMNYGFLTSRLTADERSLLFTGGRTNYLL